MKIGIITFNSAHNYGAVLQVWALQEKLKSKGHQVEVINYRIPSIDNLYRVYVPKKISRLSVINGACHKLQWVHAWLNDSNRAVRYKKFEHFINHVLPTTKPYHSYPELQKEDFDYDLMITGSDQVWNGKYTRGLSGAYFLAFGKEETKRISYAASIGRDCFDEEEKSVAARYLKDLDYISVREEKAKQAVEELTDKDVDLVLDPTLLLDRSAYDKIKKQTAFKGDYIFVHNVHLTRVDTRLNSIVEKVSQMTGLPVVNNRADYNFSNELGKFTAGGPEEFIGVIAGAKYVITNSFHATVFSIIYERNFITVPHFQNPDRMKYLLEMFDLANHLIASTAEVPDDLRSLQIDYKKVEQLKAKARVVSEQFLTKALEGEKTVIRKKPEGVHTKQMSLAQAVWKGDAHLLDTAVLGKCSGGGSAYALASAVWKQNGVVVGSSYDENMLPYYHMADNEQEASDFFKIKYPRVSPEGLFEEIRKVLESGRMLLFMGKPCKIAALYSFLGKDYDHLYTLEEQCSGTITREAYDGYLRSVEKQFDSKIRKIDWDNKTKSAYQPFVCMEFENRETYVSGEGSNLLLRAARRGMVLDEDCYTCPYQTEKISEADFTIDMRMRDAEKNPQGEDYLSVNTTKGEALFRNAASMLHTQEGTEPRKIAVPIFKVERNIFHKAIENGEDASDVLKKMLAKKVVF